MAANNAEKKGLLVPELSETIQNQLMEILPANASAKNPVDCAFDMNLPYFYVTFLKSS